MTGKVEAVFGLAGTIMVGLEPLVFIVCGVYAGAAYGGIVGALREARTEPVPALVSTRVA
jgi:ABC-type uncharacterized transport system permease subunit